jgi:hypothetical protein
MWAVAALLTLVLPAVSAPAPPEVWQGTMTYPCTAACCDGAACVKFLAQDSPINITVRPAAAATGGQASADMAWTWTVLPRPGAPNGHCVPKLEAGLNVSTKGGKWFAQGSGGTSEYYSLEATLSADGNTLSDGVIYAGAAWPGTADGTFSAQKGGARPTATCVPPPPAPPPPPPSPNLWPLPRNCTNGTLRVRVPSASFRFDCDPCAEVLTAAFGRYTKQIFAEHSSSGGSSSSAPALASLAVHVNSGEEHTSLQLGMDESYTLRIPSGGTQATLTAPTVWGALRGLETFSQLVEWDWDNATHVIRGTPWEISDAPRFPHRAFMIDTARHFEPLTVFARLLDGMTACKLNTLHWHISDIQSVAFESQLFPQIWAGRFSQNERYSTADMAWVVEQARLRYVITMYKRRAHNWFRRILEEKVVIVNFVSISEY